MISANYYKPGMENRREVVAMKETKPQHRILLTTLTKFMILEAIILVTTGDLGVGTSRITRTIRIFKIA